MNSNRSRRSGPKFFIENVFYPPLEIPRQVGQGETTSSSSEKDVEEENFLVKEIRNFQKVSEKFRLSRYCSEFQFTPMKLRNPFIDLEAYIQECADKVIADGIKTFGEVDRIAMEVESEALDFEITHPFSPIHSNTVKAFINRFELVEDSKRSQGRSIFNSTFQLNICVHTSQHHVRKNLNKYRQVKK